MILELVFLLLLASVIMGGWWLPWPWFLLGFIPWLAALRLALKIRRKKS